MLNRHFSPKQVLVVLSEGVIIFAAALLSAAIRFRLDYGSVVNYDPAFLKTGAITITYLVSFSAFDLYSAEMYRPGRVMFVKLLAASLAAALALSSIFYLLPIFFTWRGILLINTITTPAAVLFWRWIFGSISKQLPSKNVLIIGSEGLAKKIGQEIYKSTWDGFRLVGFIDDDPEKQGVSIVNPGVIGGYGDIMRVIDAEKIDMIIVALPDRRAKLPMAALLDCKLKGVEGEEGETFNERMTGQIPLNHLKPSWMVFSDGFKSLRSRKIVKRMFDVALAVVCLVISLPVLVLTALIIRLESKGASIFSQVRVGENGKLFNIYKFRSMCADAEAKSGPVWAGATDDRVTRVGRVIRKIRIDELPQLINVIKGDMSFVGPRPERPFFVQKLKEVIPYYEIRTVVKPGLTGWAQVKYPYGATVQDALEKLQYDIYYIKNMSPLMDVMIFLRTIKVVLTGRGAR